MCQKESVPACFGKLYSEKHADCQGSKKQSRCVLCELCAQQKRLNEAQATVHQLAMATLLLTDAGRVIAE